MPLQAFARDRSIEELEPSLRPLNLAFGFGKVRLEQCGQRWSIRSLSHFGQGLHELLFGMQQVPHLVDKQFVNGLGIGCAGGFRFDSRSRSD